MPQNPSHAPEGAANTHKPSSHISSLLEQLCHLFNQATHHGFCHVAAAAYAAQQQSIHPSHRLPPSRFEMGQHVGHNPRATTLCSCVTHSKSIQRDRRRPYQTSYHHPSHQSTTPSATTTPTTQPSNPADLRRHMQHLDAPAKIALARHTFLGSYKRSKTLELENNVRRLFEEQYKPLNRTGAVFSPAIPSTHSEHGNMLGCKHYARQCKVKAKCCGLFVSCRLCHDEAMAEDHEIDRFATETILCMLCMTEQNVRANCAKCGVQFAHYFCGECPFYDNTPGKKVYHCSRCNICRLGEGIDIDNYHCDKCDACVSLESKPNHICMSNALHSNCPVCRGYLFTSTEPVVFMRCGHTMHSECFKDYTAKSYQCPLCMRSLTDLREYFKQIDEVVRNEPMPEEFDNKRSIILCCDCQTKSTVKYHFMYHKCADPACASYNTKVIEMFEVDDHCSDDKQHHDNQISTDFDNTTHPEQHDAAASDSHFRTGEHAESSEYYSSNPAPEYPSVNV